jgi:hypothetical protein
MPARNASGALYGGPERATIAYSPLFLDQVRAGNVAEVASTDTGSIQGVFRKPVQVSGASAAALTYVVSLLQQLGLLRAGPRRRGNTPPGGLAVPSSLVRSLREVVSSPHQPVGLRLAKDDHRAGAARRRTSGRTELTVTALVVERRGCHGHDRTSSTARTVRRESCQPRRRARSASAHTPNEVARKARPRPMTSAGRIVTIQPMTEWNIKARRRPHGRVDGISVAEPGLAGISGADG